MRTRQHHQRRDRDDEAQESATERDSASVEQTEKVKQECDDCLSDIDDVLADVEDREPSDEEIYAKGSPNAGDYVGGLTMGSEAWSQAALAYRADLDRFAQAYEKVTGVSWGRCSC